MKRKRILCLVLVLLMLESIFTGCAKQQKALPEVETSEGYTSLSDLDNKKIGVVTGTMTAVLVPKLVPNGFLSLHPKKLCAPDGLPRMHTYC